VRESTFEERLYEHFLRDKNVPFRAGIVNVVEPHDQNLGRGRTAFEQFGTQQASQCQIMAMYRAILQEKVFETI
jgi:hypothetical protein